MYHCDKCNDTFDLTKEQLSEMAKGKEVIVSCKCKNMIFLVGAEPFEDGYATYTKELPRIKVTIPKLQLL